MFLFVEGPSVTWWWVLAVFIAVFIFPLMLMGWDELVDDWDRLDIGSKVICVIFHWGILYLLPLGIALGITIPESIKSEKVHNEYVASEYHEIYYDKIYSMDRVNEVYGKFSLGYGVVNSETYYYFYIEVAENTYQLAKIKVTNNDVYIVETTENHYYVTKNKDSGHEDGYWQIIVPKGTIVEQYNV